MTTLLRHICFTSIILLGLFWGSPTKHAIANGTAAGTTIINQAVVDYSTPLGGSFSTTSNVVNVLVNEIVRLNVVWQSASSATVIPGSTNQYITLRLTNTGNGTESYVLTTDTTLSGDQFDPTPAGLFRDSDNNGVYEPAVDLSAADNLTLLADEAVNVFIVNNIPSTRSDSTPLQDGDIGTFNVNVTSSHGNGAAGTTFPGAGDNSGTAIFGQDFPMLALGQYEIQAADVSILKTAVTEDPDGGNLAQPGATITYTLTVNVTGSGTAYGLLVSDPIPVGTSYVEDSLSLDGNLLTDISDSDEGEVSGTPASLVSVNLGDQSAGSRTISFKVTIDE